MKTTIENNILRIEVENEKEGKQLKKFYNKGNFINKRIIFASAVWRDFKFTQCTIRIVNKSDEIVWQNVAQYFRSKLKKYLGI